MSDAGAATAVLSDEAIRRLYIRRGDLERIHSGCELYSDYLEEQVHMRG